MLLLIGMARHVARPPFASYVIGAVLLALVLSSFGIFNYAVTGLASSTASTRANVTISGYIAIALSTNLSDDGISFGTITLLPANQTNATANYVPVAGAGVGDKNVTQYNVTLSTDSNQNADFCTSANTDLATSGGTNRIGLANLTWDDNVTNNKTHPPGGAFRGEFGRSMTTAYVKGTGDVAPGGADHYRFWLNVSGNTAAGNYNNTVSFRGVTKGDSCGS